MKKTWIILSLFAVVLITSCMGTGQNAMAVGGELTGVGGFAVSEPAPYGMAAISDAVRCDSLCEDTYPL